MYPLTRALYGQQVRQPIGGDFGISRPMIARYLAIADWESDVARYGIDIWMTTIAIAEGYRICQSFLGAKLQRAVGAEGKAAEAARAAQVADTKAGEATQMAKVAGDAAHQAQSQAGELNEALVNMDRFSLLVSTDVLFGFNRRTLTDEGKLKLDQLVQQAARQRRYVVEVAGYTDPTGPSSYNLVLSRDRADAVVRYLVESGVPLRQVRMIGLGESRVGSIAETSAASEPARLKPREMRRVVVRLYAPAASLWAAYEASMARDASPR